MDPRDIMKGAPPAPGAQVTRLNWRTYPPIRWSFRNARQILPTAEIRRARRPTRLPAAMRDLSRLTFTQPDSAPTTLGETLAETHADAFIALYRGRIVTEWYGDGMTPQTPHLLCSVSKSICGTLGGILVERGLIDPEAKVARYIPQLADCVYGGATVRHLLDMTVAVDFQENYEDPDGDVARYRLASGWDVRPNGAHKGDLRTFLATLKLNGRAHGCVFHYVSPNTDVLGWVYENACGQPYAQILSEQLWQPMGAEEDASITLDWKGAGRAAGGISATARDLARLGEMVRRRGLANGMQVVPGAWIDDMHRNGDARAWTDGDLATIFPEARYRSNWYTMDAARGDLAAIGIHGQWIYVDIATDTVIVKLATQPRAMDVSIDHRWLAAFRAIAAHLSG